MSRKPEAKPLREQARRLRAIAATFDNPLIKGDVLNMAEHCEELAKTIEAEQSCGDEISDCC